MTIFTKPSITVKKPDRIRGPSVPDYCIYDEEGEVIDSMPSSAAAAEFGYKGAEYPPRTKGTLFGLSIITFLVIATGIMVLVVVYQHSTETFSDPNKIFESYCVVPFLGDYRVMMEDVGDRLTGIPRDVQPIQFHLVEPFALESAPTNNTEDEVRRASLKEKFDVYLQVVYINVYDNGRVVTIVQDFEQRITGIVDKDRCFVTEMEDEFVLPPELLVVSAKRHADFDVTRLHRSLQAALPALPDPNLYPRLYNKCFHKPMYYLQKLKDNIILRKREIGYPMLDYVYFAGKHVLELEILNLDDVIYSEQVYEHK